VVDGLPRAKQAAMRTAIVRPTSGQAWTAALSHQEASRGHAQNGHQGCASIAPCSPGAPPRHARRLSVTSARSQVSKK